MAPARNRTDQPPIGDYALLGDCRTAALVSRDGSIEWLCLPRFDGGSVFGALLDHDAGGRFRIAPVGRYGTERRYVPDTNVLETTFHTPDGAVRLTDAMILATEDGSEPLPPDHEILRRVEGLAGDVELEVVCDPRFDYARRVPRGRSLGRFGIHFDAGADAVALRAEVTLRPAADGRGWAGRFRVGAGEVRRFSLTTAHAAPVVACELGDAADHRLEKTVRWWRGWMDACSYRGPYGDLVHRSLLTLKLLSYPPSGAILAAPTTSLPEAPGRERNWDYRFCWLRDASLTLEALLQLGFPAEGEAFFAWLLHATRLTRPDLQVLYDLHGRTNRREQRLQHLGGYRGARPVRIGNRAVTQLQLDVYGELLRAAWAFVQRGGRLDAAEGRLLADLGRAVCRHWREPDNGIWELRGGRRQLTHSKAMCWVALDCLLRLEEEGHIALPGSRAALEEHRDAIARVLREEGWSDALGSYTASLGGEDVDAALLRLGLTGWEDPDSDRMRGTLRAVQERLSADGLLYRYRYDDGLPGDEGAFLTCTFWEAQLLARQRRLDEAETRFQHAASFANDLGLLAEEIDPRTGELRGNFPQAFSHVALLSAATEIARGRGRPPERGATRPRTTQAEART